MLKMTIRNLRGSTRQSSNNEMEMKVCRMEKLTNVNDTFAW